MGQKIITVHPNLQKNESMFLFCLELIWAVTHENFYSAELSWTKEPV